MLNNYLFIKVTLLLQVFMLPNSTKYIMSGDCQGSWVPLLVCFLAMV